MQEIFTSRGKASESRTSREPIALSFFNRHGWYWGAEFSGDFVDSMHFELAEETILKLSDEPL